MNNISSILEGRNRTSHDSGNLLSHEISDYAKKMSRKLPDTVKKILFLINKNNITSRDTIEDIKTASTAEMSNIAKANNYNLQDVKDLHKMLIQAGDDIRMLPMFMSPAERAMIEAGKMAMSDLTMDLDSARGREAVAKQYAPLVYKIVNQFAGNENMDKAELTAAALEGLTMAMNTYKKPLKKTDIENEEDREGAEKARTSSFKSYASYMIRYQILAEIYSNSKTIKMSYYDRKQAQAKGESTNLTRSLDRVMSKGDEDYAQDHQAALGVEDKPLTNQDEQWKKVFDELGKQFSKRDIVVFLKYFGLGGEKQEKGKDIAKEFGMTPAMVTYIVTKKIIPYMKSNKDMLDILSELLDTYNESLIVNSLYKSADEIREMLLSDDVYLLLEEINRWRTAAELSRSLYDAMQMMEENDYEPIFELFDHDYAYIDQNYRKNLKGIKEFLGLMYPTESFARKTDLYILDKFMTIVNLVQKWNLNKKM